MHFNPFQGLWFEKTSELAQAALPATYFDCAHLSKGAECQVVSPVTPCFSTLSLERAFAEFPDFDVEGLFRSEFIQARVADLDQLYPWGDRPAFDLFLESERLHRTLLLDLFRKSKKRDLAKAVQPKEILSTANGSVDPTFRLWSAIKKKKRLPEDWRPAWTEPVQDFEIDSEFFEFLTWAFSLEPKNPDIQSIVYPEPFQFTHRTAKQANTQSVNNKGGPG